jgi:parallel beta-helix repeat protein
MALLHSPTRVFLALFGSAALAAGVTGVGVGTAAGAPTTLRVGCGNGAYSTIGAAVGAAAAGNTIVVCRGTYPGGVVVSKQLMIEGIGNPVINATGDNNGVQVLASGSEVEGFTVENAVGEGILVGLGATPVSKVTISHNTVEQNDRGNPTGAPITSSAYPQCNANPAAPTTPGDCGEGIHLVNAYNSTVLGNHVSANSGGILLSDDNGPTYGNLVAYNVVSNNTLDCGITIAGHTPQAFGGGVHDNTILGNQVTNNGVAGQGGGVLLASGVPGGLAGPGSIGGAVYNNHIENNYLAGNGLGGVTLHGHAPGQDLTGNTIMDNIIGANNLAPDNDFGPTFHDPDHTGIVLVAVSPLTVTIQHNLILNNVDGVYVGDAGGPGTITVVGAATNLFVLVTNPVVTVT